jgi:hypothetical protein
VRFISGFIRVLVVALRHQGPSLSISSDFVKFQRVRYCCRVCVCVCGSLPFIGARGLHPEWSINTRSYPSSLSHSSRLWVRQILPPLSSSLSLSHRHTDHTTINQSHSRLLRRDIHHPPPITHHPILAHDSVSFQNHTPQQPQHNNNRGKTLINVFSNERSN